MTYAERKTPGTGLGRRLGALALAALAASAACSKGAPAPDPDADPARLLVGIVATCASAVRDVQIRRAGQGTWEPAAAGAVLGVGDEVRTGPRSRARLAFVTGGALELEASTVVEVDVEPLYGGAARNDVRPAPKGAAPGESRVALKEGVARGYLPRAEGPGGAVGLVILSGDASEVRIAARPAQAPPRFRLTRREHGTELAMLQGAASVKGSRGETTLGAGDIAVAREGELSDFAELVEPPQALEPRMDARFQLVPALAVRLHWQAAPGASGYRIQVAHDPFFRDVVVEESVEGTDFVFVPSEPGLHAWRVATRDAKGRYGEFGYARRLHCEDQPPSDRLVAPADGTVVKAGERRVTFSWEPTRETRQYRVVLARSADLLVDPVATVVTGPRAVVDLAAPGEYWWGVYVDSETDPRPLFTRPRRLSVAKGSEPRAASKPEPRAAARPEPRSQSKMGVPSAISQWGN